MAHKAGAVAVAGEVGSEPDGASTRENSLASGGVEVSYGEFGGLQYARLQLTE